MKNLATLQEEVKAVTHLARAAQEEGMRAYKKAVLEELPGTDLSKVDKRFPDVF